MNIAPIIFYSFAFLTVVSALIILLTKNILHAAFSLIITFLCIAGVYVFAGADFVAITQIMVYIGGILVLLIFGVMLTNKISGEAPTTNSSNKFFGIIISLSFLSILLYVIGKVNFLQLEWIKSSVTSNPVQASSLKLIGVNLMSDYVLPFEIAALLLLVALIGGAFIAKKE